MWIFVAFTDRNNVLQHVITVSKRKGRSAISHIIPVCESSRHTITYVCAIMLLYGPHVCLVAAIKLHTLVLLSQDTLCAYGTIVTM